MEASPLKKSPQRKGISLSDFIIKSKIGEGSFGKVFIVQKKSDETLYALKKVSKEKLLNNNVWLKDVLTEKNVMLLASNPFIVPLYFTFQDEKNLYYGMELLKGGSLHSYIKKLKVFSEETAKFFSAQVILALKYLH